MPPKKKGANEETQVLGAGRFGRVRNNLRMGLVGLPNVGKSSLFNLFTEQVRATGDATRDEGHAAWARPGRGAGGGATRSQAPGVGPPAAAAALNTPRTTCDDAFR